jgi:triacylglycerol lipase
VSPRRRALLLAVCALLVAALAAVGLAALRSDREVRPVAQDQPGAVLLVPGYGGMTSSLAMLQHRLERDGRQVRVVALPGDGTGDIADAARAVDAAADAAGTPSVDVVGYSAGGVIARYWVKELGGGSRARRVVTLGSPHHGTQLAATGAPFAGLCPLMCQQLVPGSRFLRHLDDGDETPAGPQWLSLWTSQDEVVTPPQTARLNGAVEVVVQDVCAGIDVSHGGLPTTPVVVGIVVQSLTSGPVPAPAAADCARLTALSR